MKERGRVLGVIPARGGSRGIPRKNLLQLGGKTLIQIAIESAKGSKSLDATLVSTDDEEIASVAESVGGWVPFMRPDTLAKDDSSTYSVARHAVDWIEHEQGCQVDIVVILPPTAPFRTSEHIDATLALLKTTAADAALTVTEPDYPPSWMYSMSADGRLTCLISGGNTVTRRQDTPRYHQPAGSVYALRRKSLFEIKGVLPYGDTRGYPVGQRDAINIDTPLQFALAEAMYVAGDPCR
jgi:CMP-N,N'-diacetyllegionaminic acid synthase